MPSRMVREGLLDSDPVRQAGELAEVLFTRLMLVADDYGRFDGRVTVICRRCWPLGGPVEADVSQRLASLVREGLVTMYEVGGKPFIYLPKFRQRLRVKNPSKYPDPPEESAEREQPTDERQSHDSHPPDACALEARSEKREAKEEAQRASGHEPASDPDSAGNRGAAALESLRAKALTLEEAKIPGGDETPAAILASVLKANSCKGNAFHPLVVEWARDRITVDRLKEAIAKARQRPGKETGIIGAEYLDTILRDETKPAAQVHAEKAMKAAAHSTEKAQRQIAEQRAMADAAAPMPEALRALLPKAAVG